MIEKLTKLGKIVPEDMFPANPLGLTLNFEMDYVVFIEFKFIDDQWEFSDVSIEEFKKSISDKYLIKTKKGNFTPEFPSFAVYDFDDLKNGNESEINFEESKVGKRVVRCLRKYGTKFEDIKEHLRNNSSLKIKLHEKTVDLNEALLSFKFDGDYIGDTDWLKDRIEKRKENGKKDYYTYGKKKYIASNKLCSVTGKIENTIWGYVIPHKDYKFYAVKTEKRAVAGGFDPKTAWKNFPVSPKGAKILERGAKFMEEHLKFMFCGYKYFLIPERIFNQGKDEEFLEDLQDFKTFKSSGQNEINRSLEDDLLELLKDENNSANYTLFFYEINNAEFKILSVVEDVFPSHFRKIFDVKKTVEAHSIFRDLESKNGAYDIKFNFSHIKVFFSETKPFLEIIRSIFMQKRIDYTYLLDVFIKNIRIDFSNNNGTRNKTLRAFLILEILHNLQLIKQPKTGVNTIMDNKYEVFFEDHADFFNSAVKKGVFLEGILTKKLLSNQYEMRGSTPFRSQLKNLKLDERSIKKLLPKIIDKLESYDRNYYKGLETEISKYFLDSDFKKISNDEISFYFTMGLNLADEFKEEKETK